MNHTQLLTSLNEASQDELMILPGIGPTLAERLAAARPFDSLDEANKVKGVSASLLSRLITAEPTADSQIASESQVEDKEEGADDTLPVIDIVSVDEVQNTFGSLDVDEVQSIPALESEGDAMKKDVTPAGSRLSEIKETFKEKGQVISDGLTGLGENVSSTGQATRQAVGALSEKLEQSTKGQRRLWMVLVSSLITAVAAILLTLAVLGGINGSLKFVTDSQYATMQREADQMISQLILLQKDLDGLRGRVDTLEGFGDRTVALERAQEELAADVQAASKQVIDMQITVTAMNEKIAQQEERTQRFHTFLKELQTLLGNLFAPQGDSK